MKMRMFNGVLISFILILLVACGESTSPGEQVDQAVFRLLDEKKTGLNFKNELKQSVEFNVFNYMYFYNGGGVASEDFNKDGLPDLYFTSNMGSNKLFLNQGDMQFIDVTERAKIEGEEGWTSGVSIVDINNDGLFDIYVSQVGDYMSFKSSNQLYVCKGIEEGIPYYEEEASLYGLDLVGFSTQAVFFDYDLDGDLDMFQLNHSLHENGTFGQKTTFIDTQHPLSGDKLLRNDNGNFTEVTLEAGINSSVIGYGLGVAIGDINLDGWPDIYIGNDFHENDYLYINQQDGTFSEQLTEYIKHTSRFSMGVDVADINNDGFNDIISLDMMPEKREILKASLGEDPYDIFSFKLDYGYNHQYARNNLQLNRGGSSFSEIGMFTGIHATDWSWAPLFMDFDNNGTKDLFISNGIPRRMNDIDYVNFRANDELRWKQNFNRLTEEDLMLQEKMPQIKLPNKFFRNNGELRFKDITSNIKAAKDSYSNGAIYADLDNDGDLDVVVNNLEDAPFVYENLSQDKAEQAEDYLKIAFEGTEHNRNAIGASVLVYKGGERLFYQHFPVRGYQSCLPTGLHIGLGNAKEVDSLAIIWPDRTYEKLHSFEANSLLNVKWQEGLPEFDYAHLHKKAQQKVAVKDITDEIGLRIGHKENNFVEFLRERLIPHMVSAEGPAMAIGDANGDGLDDLFLGSSKWGYSRLMMQYADGRFVDQTPDVIIQDSTFEDVDAAWVDIENDGDLDLIVAAGGNEFQGKNRPLKQRLYLNDGQGGFSLNEDAFAGVYMTASCVLVEDFNKDGLVDVFFGGRAIPWNYGKTPDSYLFENKGNGVFEDVTDRRSESLRKAGLIKGGQWVDIDADGDSDLVLAAEWSPILIYLNENGQFVKKEVDQRTGWWNMVLAHDFDQDGDLDILAGNTGMNNKLQPSKEEPLRLYVNDFDDNDQIEQILTYYLQGKETPFATYAELTTQLVHLKKKYLFSKDFAKATLDEIFGPEKIASSQVLEANTMESIYYENTGNLSFQAHVLPDELQLSTINAATVFDFEEDGYKEVVLGGNFYESNIEMGRYDASYGHLLSIGKNAKFGVATIGGHNIDGKIKHIIPIQIGDRYCLVFAKNDGDLQVLQIGDNQEIIQ
ncbi:MAG: VCBS repeat-containing protein [Chitinophagales bacterium]|nr:VCBS repeat-containing protein [Chitinophagales bacterium]